MLASLIKNFNTDCHKQYTNVSSFLGGKLDDSLKEIERFYYTNFWISRFKRRLKEENIEYHYLELELILGTVSCLKEDTKFKLFNESSIQNGRSNSGNMIALNVNLTKDKFNDLHINNIIMHEFGHRQYNSKEFEIIQYLNKIIIRYPGEYVKQILTEKDYEYFTDDNELRLRIIPIIKEMYDNNWTPEQVYDLSDNLNRDDIKDIFEKEYILKLLNNLL